MDALKITEQDGDKLVECSACGRLNWLSKGPVIHSRSCKNSRAQAGSFAVAPSHRIETKPATSDKALRSFAQQVRRTNLTHGRDSDVFEAVQAGYLSVDDAMNADD